MINFRDLIYSQSQFTQEDTLPAASSSSSSAYQQPLPIITADKYQLSQLSSSYDYPATNQIQDEIYADDYVEDADQDEEASPTKFKHEMKSAIGKRRKITNLMTKKDKVANKQHQIMMQHPTVGKLAFLRIVQCPSRSNHVDILECLFQGCNKSLPSRDE
jgi:hypothetical protein